MAPASSALSQRIVIGVGDLAVSNSLQIILSTYGLGSCIGVVAYDPVARAGGMLHLMLPDSGMAPDKAARQPGLFADTGLAILLRSLGSLHPAPLDIRLLIAGGASVLGGPDPYRIGERNARVTLDFLGKRGLRARHAILGGGVNRALHLEIATGMVRLRTPKGDASYSLAA